MSKKEALEKCFWDGILNDTKFIGLLVRPTRAKKVELVIIPNNMFSDKVSYYMNRYKEDLENRFIDYKRIEKFRSSDSLDDITEMLDWKLIEKGKTRL